MNSDQQHLAQLGWINELLHRMTVSEAKEVRVCLCAQAKREIAELLASAAAGSKQ
ncbi:MULTISPECIES: hypothetical protein [unclassified Cupriavidus]|uniref:hypothetical protein n=1 Tax=unclassified Cupriavidus TaxID=2640874 RepID=UPI00313E4A37